MLLFNPPKRGSLLQATPTEDPSGGTEHVPFATGLSTTTKASQRWEHPVLPAGDLQSDTETPPTWVSAAALCGRTAHSVTRTLTACLAGGLAFPRGDFSHPERLKLRGENKSRARSWRGAHLGSQGQCYLAGAQVGQRRGPPLPGADGLQHRPGGGRGVGEDFHGGGRGPVQEVGGAAAWDADFVLGKKGNEKSKDVVVRAQGEEGTS